MGFSKEPVVHSAQKRALLVTLAAIVISPSLMRAQSGPTVTVDQATMQAMLTPFVQIRTLHQFAQQADEPEGREAAAVSLAYGMGWGLLTKTRFGPAFFKEGHGDGAQNYMICFTKHRDCMIILTNSDNGELAFKPLLEGVLGDTVTPWEWEGYTREGILASRQHQ